MSYVQNPNNFEEKYAALSKPLIPAHRHEFLSEPQFEPTYNINTSLQQDLNRTEQFIKVRIQNPTTTIGRQIFHQRRKRTLTIPSVPFNTPSTRTSTPKIFK